MPVYKKIENYDGGASALRGTGGPLDVVGDYELNPIQTSIIDAAVETGPEHNPDYSGDHLDGISQQQVTVRDGRRLTACGAYIMPVAAADEVFLCAGAIDSPKILLRSGIGDPRELRAAGVEPVHDLPGVGKNLRGHRVRLPHVAGHVLVNSARFQVESEHPGPLVLRGPGDTLASYAPAPIRPNRSAGPGSCWSWTETAPTSPGRCPPRKLWPTVPGCAPIRS